MKKNKIEATTVANVITCIAFCLIAISIVFTYFLPQKSYSLGIAINNDGTCSKSEMEYRCASYFNRCIFYTQGDTLGPYGDDSYTKVKLTNEECKKIAETIYKDDPTTLKSIISYEYYDTEIKYSPWSDTIPNCPEKNIETRMTDRDYECNKLQLKNKERNK